MRRKTFFSIAILAASVCIVVACGNQSANNVNVSSADSTDSAEVAEAPAATEMEQDLPQVKTSFEQKNFTVGVPEGWNTTPNLDAEASDIMVFKGDMGKIMSSPAVVINVDVPENGKSFEDAMKAAEAETKAKPVDDVTIGGRIFRCFELTEGGSKGTILCAEENGKMVSVTIVNSQVDNPEVRAVINSLKVK